MLYYTRKEQALSLPILFSLHGKASIIASLSIPDGTRIYKGCQLGDKCLALGGARVSVCFGGARCREWIDSHTRVGSIPTTIFGGRNNEIYVTKLYFPPDNLSK